MRSADALDRGGDEVFVAGVLFVHEDAGAAGRLPAGIPVEAPAAAEPDVVLRPPQPPNPQRARQPIPIPTGDPIETPERVLSHRRLASATHRAASPPAASRKQRPDRVRERRLCRLELIAGGAGPFEGPEVGCVRERRLCRLELIAGGAGPFEGPEVDRVRERRLCRLELIAGGAGPFEGPEVDRVRERRLCRLELIAGGAGPFEGPEVDRVRERRLCRLELI